MFSAKPVLSENDKAHIEVWSKDPDIINRATKEAEKIKDEGLDPNNFYYLWAITGVPSSRWNKADGPYPSGVKSMGDIIPVVAIDLATVGKSAQSVAAQT